MKKKIFLALALCFLMIVTFAIAVSAAEPDTTKETVTLADGTVCALYDTDGNGLIWYVTSNVDGVKTYSYVSVNSEYANIISTGGGANELNDIYVTIGETTYNKKTLAVLNLRDAKITGGKDGRKGNEASFPYNAFGDCKNLEYVYLHLNTGSVGHQAFNGCSGLKYVNFTELKNLVSIGQQTFNGCSKLFEGQVLDFRGTKLKETHTNSLRTLAATEVILPETFTTFGQETFRDCVNLKTITCYGTVTSLGLDYTFSGCTSLETITGMSNVFTSLTKFGSEMFYNCRSLKNVDGLISNGVLTIPSGVTSIAYKSFNGSGITSVTFPGRITYIDQRSFQYCPNLKEVYFEASNAGVELTVGDNVFGTDNSNYTNTVLEKVVFDPNCNIKAIGVYMFYRCTALKGVSMPNSVTEIKAQAFNSCSSLGPVYLSNGILANKISLSSLFIGCTNMYFVNDFFTDYTTVTKPTVYYFPNVISSIDSEVFKGCMNLNDVLVFGDNLTSVSNSFTFGRKNASSSLGVKSIVFLGAVTNFVYGGEGAYTNYYFPNPATTIASSNSGTCNVYVCKEEGTTHLYALAVNTAPTCTKDGVSGTKCFCETPNPEATVIKAQHDYGKELSYNAWAWTNNNYFANANYKHVCQDCGEEYIGAVVEDSYLFVKEGYSSFENKDKEENVVSYDVQFSIKVNQEAMDEYTNQTGKTVRYGTVAGVGNSLETPLSYAEGELTVGSSAVMSEMTGTDFVKLIIKIVKIPVTDKPVSVSCNAFAIVDNKLKYVSDGTVNETAEPKTV